MRLCASAINLVLGFTWIFNFLYIYIFFFLFPFAPAYSALTSLRWFCCCLIFTVGNRAAPLKQLEVQYSKLPKNILVAVLGGETTLSLISLVILEDSYVLGFKAVKHVLLELVLQTIATLLSQTESLPSVYPAWLISHGNSMTFEDLVLSY